MINPLGLDLMDGFVHHIIVGGVETLMFTPDRLNANIGDRILFDFRSVNHTLTQSSLENPCSPIHQFDTGLGQFNPGGRNDLSVILTVNTPSPRWYFCQQSSPSSHCHAGMIFAINPGEKMNGFRQNAKKERGNSVHTNRSRGPSIYTGTQKTITPKTSSTSPSSPTPTVTHPTRPGHTMVFFTKTRIKTVTRNCGNTPIVSPMSRPTSTSPTVKRNVSGASSSDSLNSKIWSVSAILQILMLLIL